MISWLLLALAPVQELDCKASESQGQQIANVCAVREYMLADANMNAQWRLTVATMHQRDKEIDRSVDHEPGYYETLLAGQRAWLTFRAQECLLKGFEGRGGTLAPWLEAKCMTELTRERTKQLKDLAEGN